VSKQENGPTNDRILQQIEMDTCAQYGSKHNAG
jgi:hypothetical protein